METTLPSPVRQSLFLSRLAAVLGAFAFLGGLLTLLGWYAGIYRLMDWGAAASP